MDFLGAFSGIERVAMIGGAMLVGYWGYRMLEKDRTPALIFMGTSCVVLLGVLFTGGSHPNNGASDQPATAMPESTQADFANGVEPGNAVIWDDSRAVTTESPDFATPAEQPPEPTMPPDEPAVEEVAAVPPERPESKDLLSNQELEGRIVSVKSDSITLEWSPPPEE